MQLNLKSEKQISKHKTNPNYQNSFEQSLDAMLKVKTNSVCIAFAQGCPRAQVTTAKLFRYFLANDWKIEKRVEKANLVLMQGCGVDGCSEEGSIKALSIVDSKRGKNSQLVVLGCLAGISESLLYDNFDTLVIPPVRMDELDRIINAKVKFSQIQDPNYLEPYIDKARRCFISNGFRRKYKIFKSLTRRILIDLNLKKTRQHLLEPVDNVFSLRVAAGCLGECTYCAIKFATGSLRSKPLNKVLAEFDTGLRKGFKEFKLIAGDLGAYGQDIGTNIAELLRSLLERKGSFRLTLLDFDPRYFIKYAHELIETLASNAERIRLLMVPIQSGNERILRLMRRGHTAKDARKFLCALRRASPEILVSTHVLIGFPSETEQDFEDTIQFLTDVRFDRIDVYEYTDRPKTEASQLDNKVPDEVKKTRASRLRAEFGQTLIVG